MRRISKSKLLAFRQCPKRLWLEVYQPDLREDSDQAVGIQNQGTKVGELAQQIYDPMGQGSVIDPFEEGWTQAVDRTQALMAARKPIFEATFQTPESVVLVDVLLPVGRKSWRVIEVKSSTSVKDYHKEDLAYQVYVLNKLGVPLDSAAIAHIDNRWVYQGDGDYKGLLKEEELLAMASGSGETVSEWLTNAQAVLQQKSAPELAMGEHCKKPFECGFASHCSVGAPTAEMPLSWIPNARSKAIREYISECPAGELAEVPDELLNDIQKRVKDVSVAQSVYFDQPAAASMLVDLGWPAYFLDFETINFAVPRWKGWRPYEQMPFQFSLHIVDEKGGVQHEEFLCLENRDPTENFASKLIELCGEKGPIFVYNAGFENARIRELAARFPALSKDLLGLVERVVDLLPIVKAHYYHPSQQGSWSIKKVLPAMVPEFSYEALDGVQDGGMAMDAYEQAIDTDEREEVQKLDRQLRAYCELDTMAMVKIWKILLAL